MDCLFCKIVNGEIQSKKVYEDENVIAFLDINPANRGHTLVVPKKHYENIHDVEVSVLQDTIAVVKTIADRVHSALAATAINVIQNNGQYAGQIVNHIHFHIIPRYHGDQLLISYPRSQPSEQELEEVRSQLSQESKSAESQPQEDYDW